MYPAIKSQHQILLDLLVYTLVALTLTLMGRSLAAHIVEGQRQAIIRTPIPTVPCVLNQPITRNLSIVTAIAAQHVAGGSIRSERAR
jgi:hypothetical protein